MKEYDCVNCDRQTAQNIRTLARVQDVTLVEIMRKAEQLLLKDASPEDRALYQKLTKSKQPA